MVWRDSVQCTTAEKGPEDASGIERVQRAGRETFFFHLFFFFDTPALKMYRVLARPIVAFSCAHGYGCNHHASVRTTETPSVVTGFREREEKRT